MHARTLWNGTSITITAAVAALAGCTVGPEHASPTVSTPASWTGDKDADSARPVASLATVGEANVDQWWTAFQDPILSALIERANAGNLSLSQAESRVRQARAALTIVGGQALPQVDAGASASRSRSSAGTSNLFRVGFDASWEIDIFGGIRRSVEAADADLTSAGFDRENLRVTLTAEVATAYLNLRGSQQQLAIAKQNLESQERTLALTQQRLDAGFVTRLDVANARVNVTQTESQIPAFDAEIRTSIYAISVLLGQEPAALLEELSPVVDLPASPETVPIGLPSELLKRRPDIRLADARLHAATARVGVAVADQYPRISLTSSAGLQSGQVDSLGSLANRFWSIGPSISVPVFTGSRIEGAIDQAEAIAEEATLAYRQSVLTALQDVESALAKYSREQQRYAVLVDSVAANRDAVDLSLKLYNAGKTDFLNVLTAQRQLYSTEAQLIQSRTAVAGNLVALYKALGGGWSPNQARP